MPFTCACWVLGFNIKCLRISDVPHWCVGFASCCTLVEIFSHFLEFYIDLTFLSRFPFIETSFDLTLLMTCINIDDIVVVWP